MKLIDLTPEQLKRAAAIKEQIQSLSRELSRLLGEGAPAQNTSSRNRLSAKARRNIAAAQQARWAKFRAKKKSTRNTPATAKSKSTSAANSKRSAKMKAYWAAKKAAKNKK